VRSIHAAKPFVFLLAATLVALLGVLPSASGVASPEAAPGSVVCKLKDARKVVCPTRKLRGPRGPIGPQGPQGLQGPAGAPGGAGAVDVRTFNFLGIGNTPNTTITTLTGAVVEAGCDGDSFTGDRVRATADNGAIEIIEQLASTPVSESEFDVGESVALHDGTDTQYTLTYMAAAGEQNATALYTANESGAVAGRFDCAIYGTISVS